MQRTAADGRNEVRRERPLQRVAALALLAASTAPAARAPAAEIVAVETIALTSTPAPGTASSFSALSVPVLNQAGEVGFDGAAGGADGAWWWSGGAAELVLIEGTEAPGFPGEGIDWHHDAYTQATSLLLAQGDAVEVAPGDLRTIRSVTQFAAPPIDLGTPASGGSDGKGLVWNDARQLTAVLRFTGGGEGVVRLAVPEPNAAAAALAAPAALDLRRRRDAAAPRRAKL